MVNWPDVVRILAPLRKPVPNQLPAAPPKNTGGRPLKHDWDAFWIEVAHFAALQELDPKHRAELQRHMMDWTAANMKDPAPDEATIRSRLKRLYKARGTATD
jgi:hypothetical protein